MSTALADNQFSCGGGKKEKNNYGILIRDKRSTAAGPIDEPMG